MNKNDKSSKYLIKKSISKEELNELPLIRFEGEIVLIDKEEEIEAAIQECEKFDQIGFDTETKPAFKKGVYNPVALVQLSTPHKAFLIRINKVGLHQAVIRLFENKSIEKIGIGLRDDIIDLQKIEPIVPESFVDLNELAQEVGLESIGARKLSGMFLGGRISKSQQVTNWENEVLTVPQMSYAATDAWVCLDIYEGLKKMANGSI